MNRVYYVSIESLSFFTKLYEVLCLIYAGPCIIYENDEMYQLDATIMIYYHKYLYMFRASICPSSGVKFLCRIQTSTQCTRLHTASLGPQPQHLVLNTICSTHNLYSCRWANRWPKHVEIFMIINHNCYIKLVPLVIFKHFKRNKANETDRKRKNI